MLQMIFTFLFLVSIGVAATYTAIDYEISRNGNHVETEIIVALLIVSIYCVIKIHRLYAVIEKNEKNLIELEHSSCIGKFAKGVIHDLLSPLSAINLCIGEFKDRPQNKNESILLIDNATKASRRMNDFMNCVRHHIESYEVICSKNVTANLDKEIKNVKDIIAYKAKIQEIHIEIRSDNTLTLEAHPVRVHQIFLNLISNALEADPNKISIISERSGNFAKISVIDDGCGMPSEQVKNLFVKPRSTKVHGTGIGLTCVHGIVKNELFGTIDVVSVVDVGTTFILHLPLAV